LNEIGVGLTNFNRATNKTSGKPPLAVQTNAYQNNDDISKGVLNMSKESSLGSINRGDIDASRQSYGSLAKSPSDASGEKAN